MTEALRVITQEESWRREVQQDVVATLKELLGRAETGELQGIAYACVTLDNCVSTGFTKNNAQSAIIGGLARVQHRMLAGERD